jgi:hypothetical protein
MSSIVSSNLLDYRSRRSSSFPSNYSLLHRPQQFDIDEKKKREGIMNSILQTFITAPLHTTIFYSYMIVLTSCYLWSETLQSSKLITSDAHNNNTVTTFAYDLIISWLVTYFLLNIQSIYSHNIPDTFTYWFFAHAGAIGFALLGEVSFLKNIAIVKGFWKLLTPAAWITIIFFGGIILFIAVRELIDSVKRRTLKYSLLNISLIAGAYTYMLSVLQIGGAENIHYHIHHAIFAGVLSLWFTNWTNIWEKILNAILMGIVVEGINFYGVGELFLFLTKNSIEMTYENALIISSMYTFLIFISFVVSKCIGNC